MNPLTLNKRISWDVVLMIALLAALVAFTAYSSSQQQKEERYPPGSTRSNQPDGARALKLWLDELGYATTTLEGGSFWPDKTLNLLVILQPSYIVGGAEVSAIEKWVSNGGTLIIASGDFFALSRLLNEFGLGVEWLAQPAERLSAAQPLLDAPPVRDARVKVEAAWKPAHNDYVTHMEAAGKPVLISLRHEQGRVIAMTTLEPFTNDGLKDAGNAALVYNLALAGAKGRTGKIAFDEYHHGFQTQPSLRTWLVNSRFGWAILYSLLAVFVFLLVGGKRFGAPVPLPEHVARRTTAEYIHALANLKRRAGRRQAVLAHYKDRLKRRLGRACAVDPNLDDAAFVAALAACRPDLDKERLSRLLTDLGRASVSERDMVRLARETDEWPA